MLLKKKREDTLQYRMLLTKMNVLNNFFHLCFVIFIRHTTQNSNVIDLPISSV